MLARIRGRVLHSRAMERPHVAVFLAMSLDGCIARPDGGLDWLGAVHLEGEDYGYAAFAASVDALVVGRATYDVVLGFESWPYAGKRVVVLTHRPPAPRYGEIFMAGDPREIAAALASSGARRVYVDGGATVRGFLAADLVDSLTLSVVPVVLGAGIRLFGEDGPERRFVLEGAQSWPSGLVQLRYRRDRGGGVSGPAASTG